MINVHLCGGKYLVWSLEDSIKLRKDYRIIGKFIGVHPAAPYQNKLNGLPLLLSIEEVFTCISERCVTLSADPADHITSKANRKRSELFKELIKKNQEELTSAHIFKQNQKRSFYLNTENVTTKRAKIELGDHELLQAKNTYIHHPHDTPNWWDRQPCSIINPESEHFLSELSPDIAVKCRVFYAQWKKGLFLTCNACKMGGDFLVYRGDPILHHATRIVKVVRHFNGEEDFVRSTRLAHTVKKHLVIAFQDSEEKLHFVTLADRPTRGPQRSGCHPQTASIQPP